MIVDRGCGYGDLISALLPALDPPDGWEMTRWMIRGLEKKKLDPDDTKPLHVCVSMRLKARRDDVQSVREQDGAGRVRARARARLRELRQADSSDGG